MRTAPGDTANSWDEFYAHWVHPVLHFGTPMLIAFAVLMTLAVMATPLLVGIETPGVRFAGNEGAVRGAYWLGVLCLLFSAIEATVVFPLSRSVGSARHAPWTAGVSIGLVTAALIAGFGLAMVAGRPLSANRKRLWIWGGIFLGLVTAVFVVGLAGPSLGSVHWYFAWLSRKPSSVVYAPLLAAGGIYIVAVTRGIGMGLLIQGHDKKGADDAGLGAFVRARLYSLGSQEPRGILVTQQTDTSTLPSGALGLIPAGTLAKLATLFVSLFTPPTLSL